MKFEILMAGKSRTVEAVIASMGARWERNRLSDSWQVYTVRIDAWSFAISIKPQRHVGCSVGALIFSRWQKVSFVP
jgi:hypothetical protein